MICFLNFHLRVTNKRLTYILSDLISFEVFLSYKKESMVVWNSTTAEGVSIFQHLFPNPHLVDTRQAFGQKLQLSWIDNQPPDNLMVTSPLLVELTLLKCHQKSPKVVCLPWGKCQTLVSRALSLEECWCFQNKWWRWFSFFLIKHYRKYKNVKPASASVSRDTRLF